MSKFVGTISRGIRTPIIKEGDDLVDIVTTSIMNASEDEGFKINNKDVIAVTEAVVGISQGNYATVDNIATDIKNKYPDGEIGVIFPILSRNRFAICLRGISRGSKKIYLMLSYPSDEVGNHLFSLDKLDESGINPWSDALTEEEYRKHFGNGVHPFTGVDYVEYYKKLINEEGCEVEFVFANNAKDILKYTKNVLCCDIHTRERTKRILKENGANVIFGLDNILTESVNGSGYNSKYGLLGSNKSTENRVKLFPETVKCEKLVNDIKLKIKELTDKNVEVMVYGDGAFKDPVGKIWELADPVVSPAHTEGLLGIPNELKLKYLMDNKFSELSGEELASAIKEEIKNKNKELKGTMATQGTTPRRYIDLLGSLADLTSGSGDKGTPVVLIQNYFKNYAE